EPEDAPGGAGHVTRSADGADGLPSFARADPETRELSAAAARPIDVATPSDAAAAATLDLLVLHADGVPAAGCAVVVTAPGAAPWLARTDATGHASGPAPAADGVAWVDGATLHPISFPLTAHRSAMTLTLPAGSVLEGHALIDDAPPGEPFALGLDQHDFGEDVPKDVVSLLAGYGAPHRELRGQPGLLVGLDGGFRFSGLPPDWGDSFALPDDLAEAEHESLDATAPDDARVLRLRRLPRVLLRVLMPDGQPAPRARLDATVSATGSSTQRALMADEAGRAS